VYEQISANKRKTVLLIFLFVLLLSAVGVARHYFLQGGVVGFVIVAVIVTGLVVRVVLQQRQGRAADGARGYRPTR